MNNIFDFQLYEIFACFFNVYVVSSLSIIILLHVVYTMLRIHEYGEHGCVHCIKHRGMWSKRTPINTFIVHINGNANSRYTYSFLNFITNNPTGVGINGEPTIEIYSKTQKYILISILLARSWSIKSDNAYSRVLNELLCIIVIRNIIPLLQWAISLDESWYVQYYNLPHRSFTSTIFVFFTFVMDFIFLIIIFRWNRNDMYV